MSSFPERIFDFVESALLFPARVPPKALTRLAGTFAITLLLSVAVLVFPPMKDFMFCNVRAFGHAAAHNSEKIRNWCDFVFIGCQIIIVITIGGFVFTDGVAKWLRERSETIQSKIAEITEALQSDAELTPRQRRLLDYKRQIADMRNDVTWPNLWRKIRAPTHIIDDMYKLLIPDTPTVNFVLRNFPTMPFPFNHMPAIRDNRLIILLGMRYGLAFPGGIYGGVAYFFFLLMISAAALKTYFDYAPSCS